MAAVLDLEKQLRFYGAYHHDPVNVGIHIACVPVLLLTAFLLASNTGPLYPLPDSLTIHYLPPNLGVLACMVYSSLYIMMEPVAGGLLSVLLFAGTACGNYLVGEHGMTANYWAIGLHVDLGSPNLLAMENMRAEHLLCWTTCSKPSSWLPLFVWLEILFSLGYRPELKSRIDKGAQQDIAKFRESKQQKLNGNANGKAMNGHAKSS